MNRFRLSLVAMVATLAATSVAHAQQPFSNIQQSPTVSPYLNLTARQGTGLPAYQTLVRPQIEQNQENVRQQQQISHLQRQTSALAGGGLTGQPRGVSREIRGTGHVAGFMITGNFYPQAQISTNDPITRRLVTLNYNQ